MFIEYKVNNRLSMVFRNEYIYFVKLLLLLNILDDDDYYNDNIWSRSKTVHFITLWRIHS